MTHTPGSDGRGPRPALVFAVLLLGVYLLHLPLLRLPYFWDESGYYVPAARDLLLSGSLIPRSTVSNAHPPLVMAYLAACWKVFGFSPLVTRSAMLVVAAFALLGVYRLAVRVANPQVAAASALCTALYPVFFAQSSMAHVDLAAAGLTIWGLDAYLSRRPRRTAAWFALAVLAKETALLAPLALFGWEWLRPWLERRIPALGAFSPQGVAEGADSSWCRPLKGTRPAPLRSSPRLRVGLISAVAARLGIGVGSARDSSSSYGPDASRVAPGAVVVPARGQECPRHTAMLAALLVPVAVLAGWYAYHYARTGYVFGNPEFFRYNVQATLSPLRIALALLMRVWQAFGYLHLFVLTLLMAWAMTQPPLRNGSERPRIAIATQCVFGVVVLAYIVVMAVIGGAVLARYMLPAVPLVIVVAISTVWRRMRAWPWLIAGVAAALVAGWFLNPPYGFAPEDNLAYRDYVVLHQRATQYLAQHYPRGPVLTAWPASDELSRPYLGYVNEVIPVVRVEDFSTEEVLSAAEARGRFNVAFLFSTKYEPAHPLLERWGWWQDAKRRYFGFHRDLPPEVAAQMLGGHIVFRDARDGQWVAVVELERAFEARRSSGDQDASRWQECVLTMSQTSRPSVN
jgi:hypothetical protein